MFNKILVVCVGNICRSPVGEVLLRDRLPASFQLRSAGLGALVNSSIDPQSALWLAKHDLHANEHRAQQISSELVHWADLILVMEKKHLNDLSSRYPTARGKTHLLCKWSGDEDIPDPYRKSTEAFDFALGKVEQGVTAWIEKIA